MIKLITGVIFSAVFSFGAQAVTEPWGTRVVFDTNISLEVPTSYQMVRRAARSILLKSVPQGTRVDINIIKEATELTDSVSNLMVKGKAKGWEIHSFDFIDTDDLNVRGRVEARIPVKAKNSDVIEWYKALFQVTNYDGKTIMLSVVSLEGDFDKVKAERIVGSLKYDEVVKEASDETFSVEVDRTGG